ncbi:hypothetical protein BH10ACI2_BH10ACI2_16900 [soil metagenome]
MNTAEAQFDRFSCHSDDIAAYIDGELSLEREFELDAHFAVCTFCSDELNQQKQFLCGLNSTLKNEREIELPLNFTKLVVANAESHVTGLRRPRERFNALFICAGLSLFVLFAMGAEAGKTLAGLSVLLERLSAVGAFLGHIVYSLFVGVVIILRSFATQLRADAMTIAFAAGFFAVMAVYFSRKIMRMRRA